MKAWQLILIAVKAALLLAGAAVGSQPDIDTNAVVRWECCSGVCVHPNGVILTAKHGIGCKYATEPKAGNFIFGDGRTVRALLVYQASEFDGPAVYLATDGEGWPFVPLAGDIPRRGEKVIAYGFVEAEPPLCVAHGHVIGGDEEYGYKLNVATVRPQHGCSGGPLFNARGELLGVCLNFHPRGSGWSSWASMKAAYDAGIAAMGRREAIADKAADPISVVPDRETLTICTQPQRCPPCKKFADDYRNDAEFRAAIDARFRVVFVESDAGINGLAVTQIPTFITQTKRVVGYDRIDGKAKLLKELGITAAPKTGAVWIGEAESVGTDGPPPAGEVPPPPLESDSPFSTLPSVHDEPSTKLPSQPKITYWSDGSADIHGAGPNGGDLHYSQLVPPIGAEIKQVQPAPTVNNPAPTIADKASKVIGVLGTGFTVAQLVMVAATGGVGALALPLSRWALTSVAGMVVGGVRRRRQAEVDPAKNSPGVDQSARAPPRRTIPDLEFIRVADTRPEQDYLEALRRFCNDNQSDPDRLSAAAELHRIYQQARAAPR